MAGLWVASMAAMKAVRTGDQRAVSMDVLMAASMAHVRVASRAVPSGTTKVALRVA
jgi:hypothetical protein